MDCETVRTSLSDYLDGALDARSAQAIEDHLARCGACRQELDALSHAIACLESLPGIKAPESLRAAIRVAIHERAGRFRQASRSPFTWPRAIAVAAAVLIIALGSMYLSSWSRKGHK